MILGSIYVKVQTSLSSKGQNVLSPKRICEDKKTLKRINCHSKVFIYVSNNDIDIIR